MPHIPAPHDGAAGLLHKHAIGDWKHVVCGHPALPKLASACREMIAWLHDAPNEEDFPDISALAVNAASVRIRGGG